MLNSPDLQTSRQLMGKRYVLHETIGSGGMGKVYRATDRLNGQLVALKHVIVIDDTSEIVTKRDITNFRLALAQEFKTLASLRHPHIISVLDYGFDKINQPFFTMELLESSRTLLDAGLELNLQAQVLLIVQVLQALVYLHRRGIVHRDLKPDNVQVINGAVKVLDFGLAVTQEFLKNSPDENVGGTLAYMSPEALQGGTISPASDLYAVGVMLYQLIGRKHPFNTDTATSLVHDIVYTIPDFTVLNIDPALSAVLGRLLAKRPEDRYASAKETIESLTDAVGVKVDYETSNIRESFLQSAQFVGREAEMQTLADALTQAKSGLASTWLVGGESGVGKSRVMDELRTLALVQAILALRGNAVSDGGRPYQIWQDVLRRLVLDISLSDPEAAVLKTIVPDIETLIERTVGDVPELDPQAAQDRLVSTIETILQRSEQPLAIFLEDLQWAGSESLLLLDRLSRLKSIPLTIIGSYRDDEMLGLPATLPNAQALKMRRLSQDGIRLLSESMLGVSGRGQGLVELLQRETEGNVFFLVEVMRALAEEAGQLERVGTGTLPETVVAGGMRQILQRRLQRVPRDVFPVLQAAAIIGRQLDLKVLQALYPDLNEQNWLTSCSDAAVLEVQDDRWRFAHDKLRETVLTDLTSDQRPKLHRRVAEALETVYRYNLAPYYAILAFHWSKAEIAEKAIYYLEKAGDQALENYANQEVLKFFGDAEALALKTNAQFDPVRLARWRRKIGNAYWNLGDLASLRKNVEYAMTLLGRPIPATSSQLGGKLLGQLGVQMAHRLRVPGRVSAEEQARILEMVQAYKLLGNAYFFLNESNLTIFVTLQQTNLAERAKPSPELAEAYANMCLVCGLIPLHGLAQVYQKRAFEVADEVGDPYMIGQTAAIVSLYTVGIGQWAQSRELVEHSVAKAEAIGDKRLWESVSGVGAIIHGYKGELRQAADTFNAVYTSAKQSGNKQSYLWGALGQAENLILLGELDEAMDLLSESLTLPIQNFGRDSEIRTQALFGQVYLRKGDTDEALNAAETALGLIQKGSPSASYLLQHYGAVAEIYLTLWEKARNGGSGDATALQKTAREACKSIQTFGRVFPIGKARAHLYQGWYDFLSGKTEQASKLWERGTAAAKDMQMPYEEALVHYQMGRRATASGEREKHLKQARDLFTRLGAAYDLMRVEDTMKVS